MRYIQILSCCLLLSLRDLTVSIDWCSENFDCVRRGKKHKHTMCEYKQRTSAKTECLNIRDTNAPNTRKEILSLHNDFRNKIARGYKGWPPASNMRQMTWDDTLELVALRWLMQCKEGHDYCRGTPDFQVVGQNVGARDNQEPYPPIETSRFEFADWMDEMNETSPDIITSFKGGKWGHFTQTIWAKSYKLGCAQVQYEARNVYWVATACNYGPAGNTQFSKVYKIGDPCTKCPKGTSCRVSSAYPQLCTSPISEPLEPASITGDTKFSKVYKVGDPCTKCPRGTSCNGRISEPLEPASNSGDPFKPARITRRMKSGDPTRNIPAGRSINNDSKVDDRKAGTARSVSSMKCVCVLAIVAFTHLSNIIDSTTYAVIIAQDIPF